MNSVNFNHLNTEGKIGVCAEIHTILSKHYPNSEYTLKETNKESGVKFYNKLVQNFDGCALVGDECVLIYKFVQINNPHDTIGEFMRVRNLSHDPVGNGIFIDFLVANLKNTQNNHPLKEILFKSQNLEYAMMSRRGEIHILSIDELKKRAEKLEAFILS